MRRARDLMCVVGLAHLFWLVAGAAACGAESPEAMRIDLTAAGAADEWFFYNTTYGGGRFFVVDRPQTAKIENGELVLDGRGVISRALLKPYVWSDVTLSARFMVEPQETGVLACGFVVRAADAATFYYVHYDKRQAILVRASPERGWQEIARASKLNKPAGEWHEGKLECAGNTLRVSLNGKLLYEAEDEKLKAGRVGFYASQGLAHVKDIVITGQSQKAAGPIEVPSGAKPWVGSKEAKLLDVRKIWDQGPHNAFTDLVRMKGQWYTAFRESPGHGVPSVGQPGGKIRVLRSEDGEQWESAVLLDGGKDQDLRDPHLSVTPDEKLMVNGAAAPHEPPKNRRQSFVWFSEDGRQFGEPHPVADPNMWLWSVTWHKGVCYGIGYSTVGRKFARLYKSPDGRQFDVLVDDLGVDQYPNESALVFTEEAGYCLLRRGGTGLIGTARPPYTDWEWEDLGVRIGGPELICLPDGRFVAAVRLYDGGARTSLCWIDPEAGTLREFLRLPSGGDTSYPGLVLHEDVLWMSYYSSHEGRTSIYLAKVRLTGEEE